MRQYIPNFAKTIPEDAKKVFTGVIYEVFQWPQQMFDGSEETFEMLRRPDTVKIIGVKDNKIVITHQRQPRKDWFYDLPGGRHDNPNETELEAAKREMREETGMTFRNWKLLEVTQPFTKIDWLVYTFLATDFQSQEPQVLDAGEEIVVKEVTIEELNTLANGPNAEYLRLSEHFHYDNLDSLLSAPALAQY